MPDPSDRDPSIPTRPHGQALATHGWRDLARRLTRALHLAVVPVAISFRAEVPDEPPVFDGPLSEPAEDGRRGRVAAGCVFWVRGTQRTFTTVPEDHGNCSVGMVPTASPSWPTWPITPTWPPCSAVAGWTWRRWPVCRG